MKLKLSWKIFKKYSHFKFIENSFSVGIVIPCGKTEGWTDMTTLGFAFRNFANAPINELHISYTYVHTHIHTVMCVCVYIYIYIYINRGARGRYDYARRGYTTGWTTWEMWFEIWQGLEIYPFSLAFRSTTNSPSLNRLGREAVHSLPCSAKI